MLKKNVYKSFRWPDQEAVVRLHWILTGNMAKIITHDTVAKLTEKLKKTGSITNQGRTGHPRTSTDEDTIDIVLSVFARSPQIRT
jgi:hypothetical protein